jgi:iron complex transport system ATP-binding protein
LLSPRQRSQQIAYLPQRAPDDVDLSVEEVVLLGRYPFRSFGLFESAEDYRVARHAMAITETHVFADRTLATLSGGELQRVHLAAALAQEPQLLLLDEPTASLDIQHQLAVFRILRERALRERLAVVAVTHDVNLATQFCTEALLLHDGKAVAAGPISEVLTPQRLTPVYGVEFVGVCVSDDPVRRWVVPIDAHAQEAS